MVKSDNQINVTILDFCIDWYIENILYLKCDGQNTWWSYILGIRCARSLLLRHIHSRILKRWLTRLRLNHSIALCTRRLIIYARWLLLLLAWHQRTHLPPANWLLLTRPKLRCQRWRSALDRLLLLLWSATIDASRSSIGARSRLSWLWQLSLWHLTWRILAWLWGQRLGRHLVGWVLCVTLAIHGLWLVGARVVVLRLVCLVLAYIGLQTLVDLLMGGLLLLHVVTSWTNSEN